jgi:hypothetical protein
MQRTTVSLLRTMSLTSAVHMSEESEGMETAMDRNGSAIHTVSLAGPKNVKQKTPKVLDVSCVPLDRNVTFNSN